uniref:Uncharacterized protein n=1 Tax=Cacopsylla melanoneura TaxID=428564 RepID=A0A8D9AM46_9HEMI
MRGSVDIFPLTVIVCPMSGVFRVNLPTISTITLVTCFEICQVVLVELGLGDVSEIFHPVKQGLTDVSEFFYEVLLDLGDVSEILVEELVEQLAIFSENFDELLGKQELSDVSEHFNEVLVKRDSVSEPLDGASTFARLE